MFENFKNRIGSATVDCKRETLEAGDRRAEPRSPFNEDVEVRVSRLLLPRTVAGRLLNVSPSGLRIHVNRAIAVGAEIDLVVADELVFGKIIYCIPAAEGFDVGVLIEYAIRAAVAA